jgi:hypothetical protein
MTQRMTQDEVLARAELRALVERYATITDALDYDAWVALFLPDGEFSSRNLGDDQPFLHCKGSELNGVLHHNDRWERTFHAVNNLDLSFDGEHPTGVTYCTASHLLPGGEKAYVMLIKYNDTYVLTDDGWRFAARHQDMIWQEYHEAESRMTLETGMD